MPAAAAATWELIDSLTPWDKNPRHNEAAIEQVRNSIERFGFSSPIIARESDRVIIAGHTRMLAAKKMGMDKVPVRFMKLDPGEAAALALADNKLGEIADWNEQMLADVLQNLEEDGVNIDGLGWSDEDIDAILNMSAPTDADPDEEPPSVDAREVFSIKGEVYELGPHRLVCGDSTSEEAWRQLLTGDERVRAVWSDPPYGVSYVGKTEEALTIENDTLDEEGLLSLLDASLGHAFEACEKGAAFYIASPPGLLLHVFGTALKKLDVWRHTLVWVKSSFVMGRCDYHYRHEFLFYGWKPGGPHHWCGSRTFDTVLEFNKPNANRDHPTMKPIDLIEHCVQNSTEPGWLVADPFGGSGSTLIACAATGRRARLIELDPKYCDVIRRRWTAHARLNNVDPGSGYLDPVEVED